ncbi:Malto-oligosyltrehalose synthase [Chitinispirillum alkaliphilum]|nr:Malto-oligosyltrehalose synthase [Chitinispirillum alkaliphilum]
MEKKHIPGATYRIQFTPDFGFKQALEILPYLQQLGITHIYASPVTRACSGSMHGYNVCDPREVNPELGTKMEFEKLLMEVANRQMGWIQDIVPNHMAYSYENPFLVDVLEHGEASQYSDFFDITWDHQHDSLRGRLLAPFLGKPFGQCVVDGELKVVFENGHLWVAYYDHRYPLSPESYWNVLGGDLEHLQESLGLGNEEYTSFCGCLHALKNLPEVQDKLERFSQCGMAKSVLRQLHENNTLIADHITARIAQFDTGTPESNIRFDDLMALQNFRLAFWKVASEELNYRRFFTVSDLICIRVEHQHVFEETHSFVLDLIDRGLISGLRIDHIDGLFDPESYLKRLTERVPGIYLVVEKILEKKERLPLSWPVQGTTGYDFMNHLSYIFCDRKSENRFNTLYSKIIGGKVDPEVLQHEKKRLIIGKHMAGDIDNLAQLIMRVAGVDLMGRDITLYGLRRALVEVLTHFPVYRTYISTESISPDDVRYIVKTLKQSRAVMAGLSVEYDFIERFLMMQGDEIRHTEFDDVWKSAVMRFQQFTGPLMAKGFEDTLFYVYNRHMALNEVGGWPTDFGMSLKDFNSFIAKRNAAYPLAMNATDTHDTKRGEDTRARLQVLSEIPAEWARRVNLWRKLNAVHTIRKKRTIRYPNPNDEYLLYQTLVGTFPFSGEIDDNYINRIKDYMIKAVREAKVYTAWIKPDEEYERAVLDFVDCCVDKSRSPEFFEDFSAFAEEISWFGILNSLAQLTMKLTLPGVPDIYQGTEKWNFSLVDPDNRRPVDYTVNKSDLDSLINRDVNPAGLITSPADGRVKIFVTHRCLDMRRKEVSLFQDAGYEPVKAKGKFAHNVVAYLRRSERKCMLVIVPRFTTKMVEMNSCPVGLEIWQDTSLELPATMNDVSLTDLFTREAVRVDGGVMIGELLKSFPMAVYYGEL